MSWVRLDDGFTSNPKIVQLTDQQFRVWLKVLCYCAGASDPTVDKHVRREIPGLTRHRIGVFSQLELLDESDENRGVFEVHDWPKYQPKDATGADRQAAWRARKRPKDAVTLHVTDLVTNGVTESLRPRAHARSSRPVEKENRSLTEARPPGNGIGFTIDKDLLRDIPR